MTKNIPKYWNQAKQHLISKDKVLANIILRYKGETLIGKNDAFHTLARAIIGQQISVKSADSIWNKLEKAVGCIKPSSVLGLSETELRQCGLSRQKITYIRLIAENTLSGYINGTKWQKCDDSYIIKELIKIKGIGRWTAEMFLIFYMIKPDIFPIDDIGLQKAIEKHYSGGKKLEKAKYNEIALPWKPYRTVATWYLWRSLDPVPVEY